MVLRGWVVWVRRHRPVPVEPVAPSVSFPRPFAPTVANVSDSAARSGGDGRGALASRSAFLRACGGKQPDTGEIQTERGRVPVWFMRQAGRSLPEYRAIRGGGSILDAIRQPDLAA